MFNCSWEKDIIQQQWKEAILVPIFKKNKVSTDTNSYKPISLLSSTAKFWERMLNTRTAWRLNEKCLLFQQQKLTGGVRPNGIAKIFGVWGKTLKFEPITPHPPPELPVAQLYYKPK
jgi:hypothetical protein